MKLDKLSPYDAQKTPYLHSWDTNYRENYDLYQSEIDKMTFSLQKSQRGWGILGRWNYPQHYQRELLLLNLYKRKQVVGRVLKEEIQVFSSKNPEIKSDLEKSFNVKYYIPKVGLLAGLGLNVGAHLINLNYSFRFGLLVLPIIADYAFHFTDNTHFFRSYEFLDWLIKYRTSKAQIEYAHANHQIQPEALSQFKSQFEVNTTLYDLYDKLINTVTKEHPEDLKL